MQFFDKVNHKKRKVHQHLPSAEANLKHKISTKLLIPNLPQII